ncbi:MAG: 16S rRNA (adenine(1518)-N(6)/adenine(1519)-N(6))-dimethyltransferase RsmA [Deltaproteobacteria bacterium]
MDAPAAILRRHGLRPKKSWGQNFLGDAETLARIAKSSGAGPGDTIVELGAGLGHLTERLALTGARVVAVERDRELANVLRELFSGRPEIEIAEANAASASIGELAAGPAFVVGNLPYHLSSEILFHCLAERAGIRRMVFTLQSEFVDRLVAGPGSRTYGVLSIQAQLLASVERLFEIPRGAFLPPPGVDSAVVALTPLEEPRVPGGGSPHFTRVVRGAFGQRRKTLQNSLRGAGFDDAAEALARAGIDPLRRAETLELEELGRLAAALAR